MKVRCWMTVAAVCMVVPLTLAQGQGGGRGFGGQRGGAALLSRPDVQAELKLSDAQKATIAEKLPARGGRGAGGAGGGAGGGAAGGQGQGRGAGGGAGAGAGGGAEAAAARAAEQLGVIKSILDAGQFTRYQELDLQRTGPSALARKDVADKVGLTEKQVATITEMLAAQREEQRNAFQGGGGGDREAMMAEMAKMRAANDKKLAGVLTVDQAKKWEAMLGKPFKFEDGQ